jgi:hypothetical protein
MDNAELITMLRVLENSARQLGNINEANQYTARIKSLLPIDEKTFIYPFDNIEAARTAIGTGLEAKFIKPSQPVMWETKLIDCLLACKVMKTFCACFPEARARYNFLYKSSFFYKSTTFYISYNSSNFTFEVTTGLKFKSNEDCIKNTNIDELYKTTEVALSSLKQSIKYELPTARYEEAITRYDKIRKIRTY